MFTCVHIKMCLRSYCGAKMDKSNEKSNSEQISSNLVDGVRVRFRFNILQMSELPKS